jgi:hypothetical protein
MKNKDNKLEPPKLETSEIKTQHSNNSNKTENKYLN